LTRKRTRIGLGASSKSIVRSKDELYREVDVVSSAPGRADFLNTHQDYKGLPVVPVAIDLRTYLYARVTKDGYVRVTTLDLAGRGRNFRDAFPTHGQPVLRKRRHFGNYFRAVARVLFKEKHIEQLPSIDVTVKSEIPVAAGLASSAALEVSFVKLLDNLLRLGLTQGEIAELSFLAENREMGTGCGRLDQYGSSFGGIIELDCRPPFKVREISGRGMILAVLDSGIKHSTARIHPVRQHQINQGLRVLMKSPNVSSTLKEKLGFRYDQPRWAEITLPEIEQYLSLTNAASRKRILFTIRMQQSTMLALHILNQGQIDPIGLSFLQPEKLDRIRNSPERERVLRAIGEIMNYQHELLRDLYDLSLPRLESIRDAALRAGAYGAKISGAGLGGSLVALTDSMSLGREVVEAGLGGGANRGWVSSVASGARIDKAP